MGIEEDLIRGNKGEDLAKEYLKKRHNALHVFKVPGYFPEYDLISVFERGKIRTVEVKIDYVCKQTGNIAIEYGHRNHLSGILISTADWYVIIAPPHIIGMKRRDLLYYLRENEFKEVNGGDSDMSRFYLVPLDNLEAQSFVDIWDYRDEKVVEPVKYERLQDI